MLHYESEEARRIAQLVKALDKMKAQGGTPRQMSEILKDHAERGAAVMGILNGKSIIIFDARKFKIGEVIALPGLPDADLRIFTGCPTCGRVYLDAAPTDARAGEIRPAAGVKPCPKCADLISAALDAADQMDADELEAYAERQRRTSTARLATMPPASLAMN